MKRFVLLGSAVSVLDSFEDLSREGRPYTKKDWNPVSCDPPSISTHRKLIHKGAL